MSEDGATPLGDVAFETAIFHLYAGVLWRSDGSAIGVGSCWRASGHKGCIAVEHGVDQRDCGIAIGIKGTTVADGHTFGQTCYHSVA